MTNKSINGFQVVEFDGVDRVLSCIPSDDNHDLPNFSEHLRGATTFDLKEIDLSWLYNRIMDQGSTSGCVGHGSAAGMELVWKQVGNQAQSFSPWFVYGLINHGRDAGAMISDALMALKQYGVCPLDSMPHGVTYKQQFTQGQYDAASKFKLLQAYKCANFDEICQAINLGFVVPLGIYVGGNFSQLDQEGVAPLPSSGGGGHCLMGLGLKQSQQHGWVIKIQNSWSEKFGLGGFCYLRREAFNYMQVDAFAIQMPTDTDDDIPPLS